VTSSDSHGRRAISRLSFCSTALSNSPSTTTTTTNVSRTIQNRTYFSRHNTHTMAGDHKCPVCQATFTRPQHVARHMRSRECPMGRAERRWWGRASVETLHPASQSRPGHLVLLHLLISSSPPDTGDRPYRCQHCGDQFARRFAAPPPPPDASICSSRLIFSQRSAFPPCQQVPPRREAPVLDRTGSPQGFVVRYPRNHLKAGVRPVRPVEPPVRRRKPLLYVPFFLVRIVDRVQINNQNASPAKCMHRKCRCTFVKFHRQTAPLGPGHPSRPNDPNAAILAAAAAAASGALPGVGALPMLSGLPAIPPSYRLSDSFLLAPPPAALANANNANAIYANHQFNFSSPTVNGSGVLGGSAADDYASRYRAQAELLSRAGILHTSATRGPDGYPQDLPHDGRYAAPYPRELPQSVDFDFIDGKQVRIAAAPDSSYFLILSCSTAALHSRR
jgi:hypothetical protein